MQPDLSFLAGFIKNEAGIVLGEQKGYFVESRLSAVAAQHGHESVASLVASLKAFPSAALRRDVVEALTTNETSFFRDNTPFDNLKNKILPQLMAKRAGSKRLRFWCAAASTGQEPYSLAMMLSEQGPKLAGWKIDILATDIDTAVLQKAQAATYNKFEVQRGLPVPLLLKYFDQCDGDRWQVKPAIRAMVTYKKLNLLDAQAGAGVFDVVFCRNVLIYFDLATKAMVLAKIAQQLSADGCLILGGAETVMGITDRFAAAPDIRGCYLPTVRIRNAA
ncbi:MAG: protein-glutamate O-methyltransferase CheR [Rhodospirillaceae bacterium]|nr:protein-glutamate O-methyltransferase CheR [Rhodospirillaceae bacterium]